MSRTCPVCGHLIGAGLTPWHSVCRGCSYEASSLKPAIPEVRTNGAIREDLRAVALQDLRQQNFARLLESVTRYVPSGRLLDVGSAHGWFLQIAAERYQVMGIEPDVAVGDQQANERWPVVRGYFPADINPSLRFDVISFNDVLEHIPDLRGTVEACHEALNPDGIMLLNLPSRTGAIYRTSKLLHRLGIKDPFARMWQKDLPSPHLHYLGERNLRTLLASCGFEVLEVGYLPAIRVRGLRERIAFAGSAGVVARWLIFAGMILSMPVLNVLPRDIQYMIARRRAQ
jgi:SAM-dependent methyltransferase